MANWYVQYNTVSKQLNREGLTVPVPEGGFTSKTFTTQPVIWDTFTGKRLLQWDAVTLTYVTAN